MGVPSLAPQKQVQTPSDYRKKEQEKDIVSYRTRVKRIDLLSSQIKFNQTKNSFMNDTAKSTIELVRDKSNNKDLEFIKSKKNI